jgi:hypothetical protein
MMDGLQQIFIGIQQASTLKRMLALAIIPVKPAEFGQNQLALKSTGAFVELSAERLKLSARIPEHLSMPKPMNKEAILVSKRSAPEPFQRERQLNEVGLPLI